MTNSGDQPLWLRVDASGYPQSAPLPANNVLQIERHILGTDGKSKSLDSLRSGDLVLVWFHGNAQREVERLRALSIPMVWFEPHGIADVPGVLERIEVTPELKARIKRVSANCDAEIIR